MEKLLDKLQSLLGDDLLAFYSYEQIDGLFVPVIVVEYMDFIKFAELKKDLQSKQFIILTQNDIQHGADTFALKYLHMMKHSDLLHGTDVFLDLMLESNDLRASLELEIRSKMIQLRESYLSFEGNKTFLGLIGPVLEMIWEGVLVMSGDLTDDYELPVLIEKVGELCSCDMAVFQYLYDHVEIAKDQVPVIIEDIHKHMVQLRDFVDSFGK